VERIAREADVVVDNNGTIEASMVALLHHAHVRGGDTTDRDDEDRHRQ